jgi:prepilin-type N-terminal cleavage/methylation domain-containing protein/prepilin-type processing-associated H-X9-DG protein
VKKGFTLVELLVVIGILGILSGVLITSLGGVGENAKTVKCASNMKSLASAVNSASVAGGYPFAQSALYFQVSGSSSLGVTYGVHKGWISGLDQNVSYPVSSEFKLTPAHYDDMADQVLYAVTNGAIWNVVGKTRDVYICPAHLDATKKAHSANPGWSYVMNARFGYDSTPGKAASSSTARYGASSIGRADRTLLFAEIQLAGILSDNADGSDHGRDTCLVYESLGDSYKETIGFNHRKGKQIIGHVAFADGHVEAITAPKDGEYVKLTDWLCTGTDVVFRNGSYEEVEGTEVE